MENQRLREHLRELNQVAQAPAENVKQELSKSRMNLEKIYEEGFHVCYDLYGSRRDNDEPCAFCLEVIYREKRSMINNKRRLERRKTAPVFIKEIVTDV